MERTSFLPSFTLEKHGNLVDARRLLEMLRPFHLRCRSLVPK